MDRRSLIQAAFVITVGLLCALGPGVLPSTASTTLIGSTIERVDHGAQTVTLRTREGDVLTFPVADPALLKKEPLKKGDVVSLELDVTGKIKKIVPLEGSSSSQGDRPAGAAPTAPQSE